MATEQRDIWCVVPAAGRGTRVGGDIPKQYLPLAGRPLIAHTLERLAAHPRVAGLMVALAADDGWWSTLSLPPGIPVLTTVGGVERALSVAAALQALPSDVDNDAFVLVHDAARPCVRHGDISMLIAQAGRGDGGLLAAPLRDTLKRADGDGCSVGTESRDARWRALTPQMFRRGPLTRALQSAAEAGVVVTDEAMAMERTGARPRLVEGAEDNIKVTTRTDFDLAAFLMTAAAVKMEPM